jgi:predicted N-acetyltransferase YhbS
VSSTARAKLLRRGSALEGIKEHQVLIIRNARPEEAVNLTALATRSKAYWGYDAAFMERVHDALAQTPEKLAGAFAFVAEDDGGVAGFYAFRDIDGQLFLDDMWVDPPRIGSGVGTALWRHAVAIVTSAGHAAFFIESDPNAEGFYLKMGAIGAGTIKSSSGRMLPLLRYDIDRRVNSTAP